MSEGRVVSGDIDINEIIREISKYSPNGLGAISIFIGVVKGIVDGKKVYSLDYTAYEPYASEILDSIAREESRDDNIYDIRIYHRVGSLKPGDTTLYILIAGRSRKETIRKLEKVLERVKNEPYIFKLEKREDGEYWVFGDGKRMRREYSQI